MSSRATFKPSLLDRLLEEGAESVGVEGLRDQVRRDLEDLLNVRGVRIAAPPELAELESSILAFGLQDYARGSGSRPQAAARARQAILEAVRRFEPRLFDVQVTEGTEAGSASGSTIHVTITARLLVHPVPVSVEYRVESGETGHVAVV